MWTRRFLIGLLSAATMLTAYAFDRPFPPASKRGTMSPAIYPAIVIDGKMRNLSAGARIWNQDNLIEQPASLRGNGLVVNYTENADGDIDRVWILSNEEASRSLSAQQNQQSR
jgi:hypothetical protein